MILPKLTFWEFCKLLISPGGIATANKTQKYWLQAQLGVKADLANDHAH
ncbi:hypothetical protein JWZ98_14000 [Methylomonas sp. EFPC1]|nr:hypothetical protein [Methylomonas sp. EFPC1]QSA99796.1 hypothetical protein JWZ98_14000 [Methylomonas sp. EFPC1]